MLVQFSVKNFKSIKDEVTLDMQAASISEHGESLLSDKTDEKFLPVAAIYGPNGGGKSNVLEALYLLVEKVRYPVLVTFYDRSQPLPAIPPIKPYIFSNETKTSPTEFELFFRTTSAEYRYILHIKEEEIIYESFDRLNFETNRTSSLFERNYNNIILNGEFKKFKIPTAISKTLPVLTYLGITYRTDNIINEVMTWFLSQFNYVNYGNPIEDAGVMISESNDLLVKLLKEMDIGIEGIRLEKENGQLKEVYTKHLINGKQTELRLDEESNGTIKLFNVLPFVLIAINTGMTLLTDELDAKLHPALLKYIINLFTNPEINKHNAQLIFTSHDLSTMNSEVFRRDEIWFVAKGNEQNSQLYSLIEFKDENGKTIRNDAKYNKQYLEGKYGADPYLRKIIDWENVYGKK